MGKETVSIIIPAYNVAPYLERCMESVLGQTYRDLQIILVNDGATDNSGVICDEYKAKDCRVEVIHKENGGLSSARNAGLAYAKGEYIYFLDSDDYIERNLVEVCVQTIHRTNCDVVVMNHIIETIDGGKKNTNFMLGEYSMTSDSTRYRFIVKKLLDYKVGWNAWNRFYKAQFIKENNITYIDNNKIFAEDQAYAIQTALCMNKMVVIRDALYHYMIRETSIMGVIKKNKPPIEKFVWLYKECENFAREHGCERSFLKYSRYILGRVIIAELSFSSDNWEQAARRIEDMRDVSLRSNVIEAVEYLAIHHLRTKWWCGKRFTNNVQNLYNEIKKGITE